LIATQN